MHVLPFLLLLAPTLAAAQGTGALAGRVVDENGFGIPAASAYLEGTSLGTATTLDGDYLVTRVPAGTYRVRVSSYGYASVMQAGVTVAAGHTRLFYVTQDVPSEPVGEPCLGEPPAGETVRLAPLPPRVLGGDVRSRLR